MTNAVRSFAERLAQLPPPLQDRMMDILSGAVAMYDPETAVNLPAPPKADRKKGDKA